MTVKGNAVPAVGVVLAGASTNVPADCALTPRLTVVVSLLAASVAVRVCGPALVSVTEKLPCPLVRVESGGSTAPVEVSLLLKCTVPLYEGTGFPWPSSAVTETLKGWPAVAVVGAVSAPKRKALRRFLVVCWMRASICAVVR